jgi:parvulin-like peptidyl-prolyl isomerase
MNRMTGTAAVIMMLGVASLAMAQETPKSGSNAANKPAGNAPTGTIKLTDTVGSVNGKSVTWQMLFDKIRSEAKAQQQAMAGQMPPGQMFPDPIGQAVGQAIGDKVSKGVFGGGTTVTVTQAEVLAALKKNPPQNLARTLDGMLREMALEQEATKAGLKVDNAFTDAYIARLLKQARASNQIEPNMTDDQFLESRRIKRDDLRRNVRGQAIGMVLAQQAAEKELGHPYSGADFVHARHILIKPKELGPEAKAEDKLKAEQEALEKIKGIAAEIKDKKKQFDAAARELSEDPSAKQNSGDLGTFTRGVMVPEFEKAAFAMKTGEMSEPIKSQFGYHIILVEKAGSDMKPDEVQLAVDNLLRQRFQQYLNELPARAKIVNSLQPQVAGNPMGIVPGGGRPNAPRN